MTKIAQVEAKPNTAVERSAARPLKIARVEAKQNPKADAPVAPRSADRPLKMARATTGNAAEALNASLQLVQSKAEDVAKDQAESAHKSASDATETGRIVLDLVAEQTRHGIDTANALSGATNWSALVQAQSDFIAGSFARIGQINQRYRELFWSGLKVKRSQTRG